MMKTIRQAGARAGDFDACGHGIGRTGRSGGGARQIGALRRQHDQAGGRARSPCRSIPSAWPHWRTWRRNDLALVAWLKSLGFRVKQADEHAPVAETRGQDLIIVSETVDALEVANKYRETPIPLITFENDILGDLAMAGQKNHRDYGTDEEQRFITIVNAPHPLAAGLAAGVQNVLNDEHFKMSWGKPGLGAVTIATLRGDPDKAAIFAYERGATMAGEALAPARRVSFFLWQDDFEALRPEGLALFRAAVLWSVSPPS